MCWLVYLVQGVTLVHKHVCVECKRAVGVAANRAASSVAVVTPGPAAFNLDKLDHDRFPVGSDLTLRGYSSSYLLQCVTVEGLSRCTQPLSGFVCRSKNCASRQAHSCDGSEPVHDGSFPLSIPCNLKQVVLCQFDGTLSLTKTAHVIDVGRATARLGMSSTLLLVAVAVVRCR